MANRKIILITTKGCVGCRIQRENIEKEMKKISKDGKRIVREELSKKEALEKFGNDPYKVDLINNMSDDEVITAYRQNDFVDLCRGPHVESTKCMKYFKLLKVSGAYYKEDSKNKMLGYLKAGAPFT